MKNIIIAAAFLTSSLLCACSQGEDDEPTIKITPPTLPNVKVEAGNKLLILKVSCATNSFEGGLELTFSPSKETYDTIPLEAEYVDPADFDGYVRLTHVPTHRVVFDASVCWGTEGKVNAPTQLSGKASFEVTVSSATTPSKSQMQLFCKQDGRYDDADFSRSFGKVWDAVSNLKVVNDYYSKNKNVGVLQYFSVAGVPDAQPDAWYILLYN